MSAVTLYSPARCDGCACAHGCVHLPASFVRAAYGTPAPPAHAQSGHTTSVAAAICFEVAVTHLVCVGSCRRSVSTRASIARRAQRLGVASQPAPRATNVHGVRSGGTYSARAQKYARYGRPNATDARGSFHGALFALRHAHTQARPQSNVTRAHSPRAHIHTLAGQPCGARRTCARIRRVRMQLINDPSRSPRRVGGAARCPSAAPARAPRASWRLAWSCGGCLGGGGGLEHG